MTGKGPSFERFSQSRFSFVPAYGRNHSNFLQRLRERLKAVGALENHRAVTENDVISTLSSECLKESLQAVIRDASLSSLTKF